jgi:hypothetical protein
MVLVLLTDGADEPAMRGLLLAGALWLVLAAGVRRPALSAVLIVPTLVLMSMHAAVDGTALDFLRATLPSFVPVVAVSALAHWLLWTLQPGAGRVAA